MMVMKKDHGEIDGANIIEHKRNSIPTQQHNVSTFHVSHEMATLEAQVEAFVHLAKEIPSNKAFSGPNSSNFIEAYKKEVPT